MNKLTNRQDKYARYRYEGKTQREAWGLAGFSTKYPVEDIDSHACMLEKTDKIQTRLAELRSGADKCSQKTVEDRKRRLEEIGWEDIKDRYDIPIRNPNIQAIAELNKMEGLGQTLILLDPVRIAQAVDELRRKMIPEFIEGSQKEVHNNATG